MYRAELSIVFAEKYRFLDGMVYGTLYDIPLEAAQDMFIVALFLPLCEANLRWEVSSTICATDATPKRRGASRCGVPSVDARDVYRACCHSGEYTRMRWGAMDEMRIPSKLRPASQNLMGLIPYFRRRGT